MMMVRLRRGNPQALSDRTQPAAAVRFAFEVISLAVLRDVIIQRRRNGWIQIRRLLAQGRKAL
jgi:hypothetical protein